MLQSIMTDWKMRPFWKATLSGFALAALALSAHPVVAQSLTTVQVAAFPLDLIAPVYYAQDLGMFKKQGLDVQIQAFSNVESGAAAMVAGSVDIGSANNATMAQAHLRGIDFKYLAPAGVFSNRAAPTEVVAVLKDSSLRTAADLNGKTIAVAGLKSMLQIATIAWADKHGGDGKSLKFVEIPFPQMDSALVAHRVDAVVLTEPFVTAAKADTRSIGSPEDGIAPTFMTLGWFATGTWLAAHPDAALRFASAIREANAWGNAHQKESAVILSRYSKMPITVVDSMARATYGSSLDPKLVQPAIDACARYGIIDRSFPATEIIWAPSAQK